MTRPGERGGWTAWTAAWAAIVAASLLAAVALAQLSAESSEAALDDALAQHLRSEASILAETLRGEPLEAIAALGGPRSADAVRQRIESLSAAGSLHDAALFAPGTDVPLSRPADGWVPGKADAVLIHDARSGAAQLGPLYRAEDGQLYRAAYVSVPGHADWVLGVEGSGATLSAVDRLEDLQLVAGAVVVALAAIIGAGLAAAVTRPLHRLDAELGGAAPGDAPETLTVQGPREVRRLARSARRLLVAIRERDRSLADAHAAQLRQLTTLAAAVAHEVRNPLHALGFTVVRLGQTTDADKRVTLATRATACVDEMERIVARFLDLSRPIAPRFQDVDVTALASRVVADSGASVDVEVRGTPTRLRTDPELLGQVLRNLLRNAAEAGAAHIVVAVLPDGIRVQDDGPGVSEVDAEHVFTWFHTSRAQGTGLGLPQSRRICEALGGDLRLEAARPATFRILLPPESP